jgi:hypothetical protein
MVPSLPGDIHAVEVIAAQILILTAVAEKMERDHEDAVRDGDCRTLGSSAFGNASVLGSQVTLTLM